LTATPIHTHRHDGPRADGTDPESLLERLDETRPGPEHDRLVGEVVRAYLSLADALATRYAGRGVESEDLVQVARTALVGAVRRYRPGAGRGFEAFAVPTIRGELKRHFRDCGWTVRPPRRLQELRAELSVAEEELRHRLCREVTDDELAAVLHCPRTDVDEVRRCASGFHPVSLDAPTTGGGTVGALLPDADDGALDLDLRATIEAEVARLTPRERLIVHLRFAEERTQSEIGQVLGVSQMQVSRLLGSILDRLRLALALPPAA
jgi:RNA polymerase sigma-B factor